MHSTRVVFLFATLCSRVFRHRGYMYARAAGLLIGCRKNRRKGRFRLNYQEKWSRNVTALKDFVEKHGHANVPSAFSASAADGKELFLGPWVSKIRSQYRSGKILPHRARELEAISGWHWEASRPGPRVSGDRDAKIAERYEAGETTRQIADALSLTTQRVNQILRRSGK